MANKNQQQISGWDTGVINLVFRARILWRDLATWIRAYLISAYSGLEIQKAVGEKLYRLPLEHGNVFKLFFGDKATEGYIALLSNYIITLESLFHAQIAGDTNTVNELTRKLYDNINQKAAYLARINPFWQEDVWRSLMINFTSMTIEQSTTFLTKDYRKNIEIFERILAYSTVIGDYFSGGLLNYISLPSPTNRPNRQRYGRNLFRQ